MRWIARKRFDLAVKLTTNKLIQTDDNNEFKIFDINEIILGNNVYELEVVAGHTDGFDVIIKQDEYGIRCEYGLLKNIGIQLCKKLTSLIKVYDYGMLRLAKDGKVIEGKSRKNNIKLKTESLSKGAIYINSNTKILLQYDGSIIYKGTCNMDIQNCTVQKRTYEKVVKSIFENEEMFDMEIYHEMIKNELCNVVNTKNWMNSITRFAKYTKKRNLNRFKKTDQIVVMFERMLKDSIDVPSIDQYAGFIWVIDLKTQSKMAIPIKGYCKEKHKIDFDKYTEEFLNQIGFLLDLL